MPSLKEALLGLAETILPSTDGAQQGIPEPGTCKPRWKWQIIYTSENSHKDVRPSEIADSEEATKKVLQAISNSINPFAVEDKDSLYWLSSGAPASKDIEEDLLMMAKVRKEA